MKDALYDYTDFVELVAAMRAAQKEYFRTRSKSVLEKSKRLERCVDALIKNIKDEPYID